MTIVFFSSCKYNLCLNSWFRLQKAQKSKSEALYERGAWISCHSTLPPQSLPGLPSKALMQRRKNSLSLWLWSMPDCSLLSFNHRGISLRLQIEPEALICPKGLHPDARLCPCLKQVFWVVRAFAAISSNKPCFLAWVLSVILHKHEKCENALFLKA